MNVITVRVLTEAKPVVLGPTGASVNGFKRARLTSSMLNMLQSLASGGTSKINDHTLYHAHYMGVCVNLKKNIFITRKVIKGNICLFYKPNTYTQLTCMTSTKL